MKKSNLLLLSICPIVAFAADSISPLGYSQAGIDGVTDTSPASLPSGWSVSTSGNDTTVVATRTASRKKNQAGTDSKYTKGEVLVQYLLQTTRSIPSSGNTIAYFEATYSAHANINQDYSGFSGVARGAAGTFADTKEVKRSTVGSTEVIKGPHTVRVPLVFPNSAWSTGSPHEVAVEPSSIQIAKASAKGPGGSGNIMAIVATGTSTVVYHPVSLKIAPEDSLVRVSGSANTATRVFLDVATSNNVPIRIFATSQPASGTVESYLDVSTGSSYYFTVSAPGALRKRISVTLGTNDVSGLDFTLKLGDLDGDNYVSQAEADYVYNHIGATSSHETSWLGDPTGSEFWDSSVQVSPCDADLNGDGSVTSADWLTAAANVGEYGD